MTTFFQLDSKDTLARTFTIERELPAGSMGRVFVATERATARKVVVKLLAPKLIPDLDRLRFHREIKVAAQLKHPHIVPVLSADEHKDLVWYAMPFIEGRSLRSAVKKRLPMTVSDVLRVLRHVAEALDYAHGEGVIHRDINPANVLQSGTHTLVTDFGVAKALIASLPESTVTVIGTPAYMAPEQLAGDPSADHRIDIYAVGVLARQLLKRRSPFTESTPSTSLPAGRSPESQPLTDLQDDIPRSLSDLIMRCLSREPDERPATARELLNALDEISSAEPAVPPPPEPTPEPTVEPTVEPAFEPALEPALEPMSLSPPETTPERMPAEQTLLVDTTSPQRHGKKMLAGGLVLILPIAAGAILLSRRSGTESSGDTVARAAVSPLIESAPLKNSPENSPVKVETRKQVSVSARQRALRARADSIQKARAEWAKLAAQKDSLQAESARRAAALSDSLRRAEEMRRNQVRRAAAALLENRRALESFMQGATHKGGLLGNKTKGDLQTQIDALQPFLNAAGLSYEQFKDIVKASGVGLFDKFGRMVPDSLHRVAGTDR
jgi:serine/threonine-protein kinase